ncbi:MAG: hypothetical protein SFY81_05515 [Verrucomicrobiota bacterium]|nr:hypothetical protein [Verrucomicrobiota bacterium]
MILVPMEGQLEQLRKSVDGSRQTVDYLRRTVEELKVWLRSKEADSKITNTQSRNYLMQFEVRPLQSETLQSIHPQ